MKKLLLLWGLAMFSPSSFSGTAGEEQIIQQYKRDGLRQPLNQYRGMHLAKRIAVKDFFNSDLQEYVLLERDLIPTTFIDGIPTVTIVHLVSYFNYKDKPRRAVRTYIANCKVENDVLWKTSIDLTQNVTEDVSSQVFDPWYAKVAWTLGCRS